MPRLIRQRRPRRRDYESSDEYREVLALYRAAIRARRRYQASQATD